MNSDAMLSEGDEKQEVRSGVLVSVQCSVG